MRCHRTAWMLLLLVAVLAAAYGHAEDRPAAQFDSGRTSTSLPFKSVDGRIFVSVKVNGEGPFAFLFDTGGDADISSELAERLHLSVGHTEIGTGTGEKPVTAVDTTVRVLQIGDLRLSNVAFHAIWLDDAPAVFGKQPVDGIIGFPILEKLIVDVDYESTRLRLTLPSGYTPQNTGTTMHFERLHWVPLVDATLDGIRGKFGVDTGARLSLLLYGPFVEQNDLRTKYASHVSGVTGWGLGGPIRSQLARARIFTFGSLEVRDLLVRLSLQKSGALTASDISGLIGPDILSQFNITFDYGRQSITFRKNRNYGKRSAFDRVGVWLGQDSPGFKVIDVATGSPADDAGLKVGDTVLVIDGKPAKSLDLTDVR
jgi:hypothetical protein